MLHSGPVSALSVAPGAELCLDEQVLAGFIAGTLDAAAIGGVEAHLQVCSPCFAVVAALAGDGSAVSQRSPLGVNTTSACAEHLLQPGGWERVLPVRPGQIFAERYRIDRFLAKGGHGAVFVAQHLVTEAPVALKILWQHVASSYPSAEAFELEAKVAARAKSEFIVQVIDGGVEQTTGMAFLAMELLEGCCLSDLVRKHGPVSVDDALLYLSHVAQGLECAHNLLGKSGTRSPVVHRDLKPENLFLTLRSDGRPIVKILDFGLAKVARDSGALTATICGTPCYMAYEQITRGRIGPCTDVWAFGLVTFFLLSGRQYWLAAQESESPALAVLAEVLHESLVSPTVRARQLGVRSVWSSAFDRWFLGCVHRDPQARFQSVGAAYTALLESLVSQPSAVAPALVARRRRPSWRSEQRGERAAQLGAHWDGDGVHFALFSEHASAVELCLFDPAEPLREVRRIHIAQHLNHVWRAYVKGVRPGQPYGYRVHGPFAPAEGHRFNPNKLLLDPYALSIRGPMVWHPALLAYDPEHPEDLQSRNDLDSAPFTARSVVVDPEFPWGEDRPPRVPWADTVIYEAHVKGVTMTHPDVPEHLRGTYLGLASDAILEHLLELGVTAVELLPVQQTAPDRFLVGRGLPNYWGYWTIGYFAPDARYATRPSGDAVAEFKSMVRAFHRAGIEVLLDVVYNHTAEGDRLGPTLCFRGIDNANYYRLVDGQKHEYQDFSKCGNSLSLAHPRALQFILDSLRYWVQEMHVDGFRFDLGPVLGRDEGEFDARARFFATVQQDPVLRDVKLIAEPWDNGPNGYRLGAFPPGWSEWNNRYAECLRRFWRGDLVSPLEFGRRISGSRELFGSGSRGVEASINFVTCHDGFTLHDLVSYERQHQDERDAPLNQPQGDLSANWGEEGPSAVLEIIRQREVMKKNFLATLGLSAGVPMILHGDEMGRTQRGNGNAFCQDNELVWMHWEIDERQKALLSFAREVFAVRAEHPELCEALARVQWTATGAQTSAVTWLHPDGSELAADDWLNVEQRVFALRVEVAPSASAAGKVLLVAINSSAEWAEFALQDGRWVELLNTAGATGRPLSTNHLRLESRSLVVLCWTQLVPTPGTSAPRTMSN